MILIAGLGNPGEEYSKTRHNVGFQVLDLLAEELNLNFKFEKKFNAEIIGPTSLNQTLEQIILAKPHTFMNKSGDAVQKIAAFYKISPENCWIIFDELDLPLGKIKILQKGGPGTHNGMKSIVNSIGKNFPRFRIGIESRGISAPEEQDTHSFVLSPFKKDEKATIENILMGACSAILLALKSDLETAMNKFN